MPTLKEFLASQAERLRSQESDAAQRRDEWLASLNRLLSGLEPGSEEADTASVLTLKSGYVQKREVGIGSYDVPA